MSPIVKISPLQWTGALGRLFRIKKTDKLYDMAKEIDEADAFHLPFAMEGVSFSERRLPVISMVSRVDKGTLDYLMDYVEDAPNRIVMVSDTCRTGHESLFAVTAGTSDDVTEVYGKWYRSMIRSNSPNFASSVSVPQGPPPPSSSYP